MGDTNVLVSLLAPNITKDQDSYEAKLNHLLHVAHHPPPDLSEVWVILRSILRLQYFLASCRELGCFLRWAWQLSWTKGDHAEYALKGIVWTVASNMGSYHT